MKLNEKATVKNALNANTFQFTDFRNVTSQLKRTSAEVKFKIKRRFVKTDKLKSLNILHITFSNSILLIN